VLQALYGARVTGEIQRLRIDANPAMFVILDTGAGYIQCQIASSPTAIYCEAQSAYGWPAMKARLTPERIAHLHTAGYDDSGRSENYSKMYRVGQFKDEQMADEILALLNEVYGYADMGGFVIHTEQSRN
jgi:hypothetical protein